MKKDQADLQNAVVRIPDSKTPMAIEAFRRQMANAGDSPFLFPAI